MKSRITIEVNFDEQNLPVIQIIQQSSDDVRDKLVRSFLQSLQHTSRWCRIEYLGNYGVWNEGDDRTMNEAHRWHIRPITTVQIPEEIKLMQAVLS